MTRLYGTSVPINVMASWMTMENMERLLKIILGGDRRAALQPLAAVAAQALAAEAWSVFLCPESSEDSLVFEAGAPENWAAACGGLSLSIPSFRNDWLCEAAFTRRAVRLDDAELARHIGLTIRDRPGTPTSFFRSVLALPLLDRKGTLYGAIEFFNKHGAPGFTADEDDLAKNLATPITVVLALFRLGEILRRPLTDLYNAKSLEEIYAIILSTAVELLHGDRGDLAMWDWKTQDLVVRLAVGESRLAPGNRIPEPSVMRQTWKGQEGVTIVEDVRNEPAYYELDTRVRSEVAVRWELQGRPIGVVNVESLQKGTFNEIDAALLRYLGKCAALAYQTYGRHVSLRNIYLDLVETSPPSGETLNTILESVRDIYGFDAGLIYLAEEDGSRLRCSASIGCSGTGFSYKITDQSLATEVYRKGIPIHVPDPQNDPIINAEGVKRFNIRSSLVGVPLVFRDQKVGVLVVWHTTSRDFVKESHGKELEPFARVAAANIALAEAARRRERAQLDYRKIQLELQSEISLDNSLRIIMEGVRAAGFDRVRVFDLREVTRTLECRASLGGDKDLRGLVIYLSLNPYARDTIITAGEKPRGRIYDPRDPQWFGPDRDAPFLDKPPDLPWAVVPLSIPGKVCGQLVADNALSRRQITQESLDALTLMGGLAGQAIANERRLFELASTRALPILFDRLGIEDSQQNVVRRILVYATCQEALGFSRALFFERKEGTERLEYVAGLGSITPQRHAYVTRVAREKKIIWLLENVWSFNDAELDKAVGKLSLDLQDSVLASLNKANPDEESGRLFPRAQRTDWPQWLQDLAQRIAAEELAVALVRDEQEVLGMLVVDRRWQERDLTHVDASALAHFSRQACQILRQHGLYQQVLESRDDAALGFITKGLAHELRQPIGVLKLDTGNFKQRVERKDFRVAIECADRIDAAATRLDQTVIALTAFLQAEDRTVPTDLRRLLDEVFALCKQRAEDHCVKITIQVAPQLPTLPLIPKILKHAMINLTANALDAFERTNTKSPGTLDVTASLQDGWLTIQVRDNGPGMSQVDVDRVHRRGSSFTGNPSKGLGIGLQIARRAAEAHQRGNRHGYLDIKSQLGGGTTVFLVIPVGEVEEECCDAKDSPRR